MLSNNNVFPLPFPASSPLPSTFLWRTPTWRYGSLLKKWWKRWSLGIWPIWPSRKFRTAQCPHTLSHCGQRKTIPGGTRAHHGEWTSSAMRITTLFHYCSNSAVWLIDIDLVIGVVQLSSYHVWSLCLYYEILIFILLIINYSTVKSLRWDDKYMM